MTNSISKTLGVAKLICFKAGDLGRMTTIISSKLSWSETRESESPAYYPGSICGGAERKCNLFIRFAWDQFAVDSKSTIGVEFATRSLEIGNQIVKVQVWDTAGQERYRAITTAYYRDAVGAIVVYDITKEESYSSVARWVRDVRTNTNNRDIAIMLVGNKCDRIRDRAVPLESAKAFARNNDLRHELVQYKNQTSIYLLEQFCGNIGP